MTPEQQQRAIAEACGWTKLELYSGQHSLLYGVRPGDNSESISRVPNYLEDLNAIHRAVLSLKDQDFKAYMRYQQELIRQDGLIYTDAPASNRAVAFLKAKGLWV